MTPLIDFHTHSIKNIHNKCLLVKEIGQRDSKNFYVAGIHPWDLKTSIDQNIFKQHLDDQFFLGIGEIGLDKSKPNFDLQIQRFEQQIKIAKTLDIRFLVIHNLKATEQIIKILKEHEYSGVINLHGFNSSIENFNQFSDHFKTIISVGEQYLKSSKLQGIINRINLDYIFFESDDSAIDILELYKRYALQNSIDLKELTEQLNHNFTKLIKTLNIQH